MERRQRVAELLNSAFRADLEELVTLHYELITNGVGQTLPSQASTGSAPNGAAPAAPRPPRGPAADSEGMNLRALESRIDAMASDVRDLTSQCRQMGQLLASGFSLSLSLQEQFVPWNSIPYRVSCP